MIVSLQESLGLLVHVVAFWVLVQIGSNLLSLALSIHRFFSTKDQLDSLYEAAMKDLQRPKD